MVHHSAGSRECGWRPPPGALCLLLRSIVPHRPLAGLPQLPSMPLGPWPPYVPYCPTASTTAQFRWRASLKPGAALWHFARSWTSPHPPDLAFRSSPQSEHGAGLGHPVPASVSECRNAWCAVPSTGGLVSTHTSHMPPLFTRGKFLRLLGDHRTYFFRLLGLGRKITGPGLVCHGGPFCWY